MSVKSNQIYFAFLWNKGDQITVIAYGATVHWALNTLNNNPNVHADLIDLRSLQPLDTELIFASAKKTGKVIILQEDSLFGGKAKNCLNKLVN